MPGYDFTDITVLVQRDKIAYQIYAKSDYTAIYPSGSPAPSPTLCKCFIFFPPGKMSA